MSKTKRRKLKADEIVVPIKTMQSVLTLVDTSLQAVNVFGNYVLNILDVVDVLEPTNKIKAEELKRFRASVAETMTWFDGMTKGSTVLESLRVLTAAGRSLPARGSDRVM